MWGDVPFYDLLAVDFSNFVFGTDYIPVVSDPTFGPFQQFDLIRPPLFPVILGCCYALFGHTLLVGQLVNGILGAVIVILVFGITRAIFDIRVAWIASLFTAVYPPFIYLRGVVYPETIFSLLLVACVGFLIFYIKRDKLLYVVISAFSGGLAVLARPNFIAVIPFLALVLLFTDTHRSRRWIAISLFIFVSAIALIPRPLYNYVRHDVLALTGLDGGYALFLGNNSTSTTTDFDRTKLSGYSEKALTLENDKARNGFYYETALSYIKNNPIETAKRWLVRPVCFFHYNPGIRQADFAPLNYLFKWVNFLVYGPVLLFWLVGLFVLKERRTMLPINVAIITMAVTLAPVTMRVRYRIPVEPLLIIIASGAAVYIFIKAIDHIKKPKGSPLQNEKV